MAGPALGAVHQGRIGEAATASAREKRRRRQGSPARWAAPLQLTRGREGKREREQLTRGDRGSRSARTGRRSSPAGESNGDGDGDGVGEDDGRGGSPVVEVALREAIHVRASTGNRWAALAGRIPRWRHPATARRRWSETRSTWKRSETWSFRARVAGASRGRRGTNGHGGGAREGVVARIGDGRHAAGVVEDHSGRGGLGCGMALRGLLELCELAGARAEGRGFGWKGKEQRGRKQWELTGEEENEGEGAAEKRNGGGARARGRIRTGSGAGRGPGMSSAGGDGVDGGHADRTGTVAKDGMTRGLRAA
ncbi:hypothetical protein BRADI_5g02530v3 [Brachypodium distachyon]|uniref:Uncharacterized protein n=1 Tax=Brachypodium distachyon TaxID=15368 RepID=A0A0Q3GLU1_BRADI|nr:hypothetical protein BRADI_5g02530v3 [Brachypodium distachyon]